MGNQIPYKKLTRKGYNKSKAICDGCKQEIRVRNIVFFKKKYLCRNCRNKLPGYKIQASALEIGRGKIRLEDALNKEYNVYFWGGKCSISLPQCFIGKKVRVILTEDSQEGEQV